MITPNMAAKAGKAGKASLAKSKSVSSKTPTSTKPTSALQTSHGLSPRTAAKVVAQAKASAPATK